MTGRAMSGGDRWFLTVGRRQDGQMVRVPLADGAALVAGGQPGSGKTSGLRTILAPLFYSPNVQFAFVDGKGSDSWSCVADRAFANVQVVDDLEPVVELLRHVDAERKRRGQALLKLLGTAEFWANGPGIDLALIVVVLDEAQAVLDSSYWPRQDKEAQGFVSEAQGLVKRLVALGRSSGIYTVLTSQKPTSDAIPTVVRDNSTARLAFSLATREGARAVLGDVELPDGSPAPSPLGLAQGQAILGVSGPLALAEPLVKLRVPFAPESLLRATASATATLTANPCHGAVH